jgi:hypothetical protein
MVAGVVAPQAIAAVMAVLILVLRRKDLSTDGLVGPLVAIAVIALALVSGAESVPLDGAYILYATPALAVVGWCIYQVARKDR